MLLLAALLAPAPLLAAQSRGATGPENAPPPANPQTQPGQTGGGIPANLAPPRSDHASSSEQTRIDLSPPKADALAHPDGGHAADDALGTHEWNPLRAKKDVEVGDFYYNVRNYKAALSRYREALQYKPRDAVATFKLAQALEKNGEPDDARTQYEAYLEILKNGPKSGAAREALQRLKKQ